MTLPRAARHERHSTVAAIAIATVIAFGGCGEQPDVGTDLGAVGAVGVGQPVTPIEPVPPRGEEADGGEPDGDAPDSGPMPDPVDRGYEAMCLNYCEALERTILYACIGAGHHGLERCVELNADVSAARCFELRCVSRRVDSALCLTQCGNASDTYEKVCGAAIDPSARPAAPVCSPEVEAKNADCAARCTVETPSP